MPVRCFVIGPKQQTDIEREIGISIGVSKLLGTVYRISLRGKTTNSRYSSLTFEKVQSVRQYSKALDVTHIRCKTNYSCSGNTSVTGRITSGTAVLGLV